MKLSELREALIPMQPALDNAEKKRRKGEKSKADINTTAIPPQRKPWRTDNPI